MHKGQAPRSCLCSPTRAPTIRALAARALGELSVRAALPTLERVQKHDADAGVRAEASIAALWLGADALVEEVVLLLSSPELPAPEGVNPEDGELSMRRRAALAVARLGRVEAVPVLAELAGSEGAQESARLRAVEALGELGNAKGVDALIPLLEDVRLCPAAADVPRQAGWPPGGRRAGAQARQRAVPAGTQRRGPRVAAAARPPPLAAARSLCSAWRPRSPRA